MSKEAEIMMNILLSYLEGNYTDVMVSDFFSAECVDRCLHMGYDVKNDIVIDKDSTFEFNKEEEDNIVGFSLTVDNNAIEHKRPGKKKQKRAKLS